MKSVANDNWLNFSLSPHINNIEEPSSSSVPNTVQNCNFFLSPTNTSTPSLCYEGENAGLYSQLSFMPIKSDGSLCIMEALNRSQNQGMVPSPKLEDFLGGCGPSTGAHHHHYMNNDGEATTMYYQPLQEMYHQPILENEAMADEDEFPSIKNWFTMNYNEMGYGDLQSLSLSMSPGSQSNSVSAPMTLGGSKKRGCGKGGQKQPVHRKSIDTFGQRTSQYRGVTRHRWTGRYEAHLWDNSCKKEGETRKGRQVYLGGYDMEEKAARAYDLAALKYWGPSTHINFPLESYHVELEELKNMSRQEYVAHLRRKSSGFSRGASIYRGVTRHHQHGRWQARIGRVAGNKDLYLGTFSTQEAAAEAYDIAAIKFRGASAVTNFDITRYDVEKIMASNTLLSGEDARRIKVTEAQNCNTGVNLTEDNNMVLYESPNRTPIQSSETLGLIGIDETMQMASAHISNSSSLVTSLNSSREVSQEPRFNLSPSPISSWIQSTQIRPEISVTQMPVFGAWSDV